MAFELTLKSNGKVLPDLESGLLPPPSPVKRPRINDLRTDSEHSHQAFIHPEAGPKPATTTSRFRVVGQLILAMKRFQAALNPTYEYGKREVKPDDGMSAPLPAVARGRSRTMSGTTTNNRTTSARTFSGRTMSGRPLVPGIQHGHKTSLLLRPLPELKQEAQ